MWRINMIHEPSMKKLNELNMRLVRMRVCLNMTRQLIGLLLSLWVQGRLGKVTFHEFSRFWSTWWVLHEFDWFRIGIDGRDGHVRIDGLIAFLIVRGMVLALRLTLTLKRCSFC